MYKLTNSTSILRLSDGAFIPSNPLNLDYEKYLGWLSDGNAPEPVDQPTQLEQLAAIEAAITKHMDSVAQAKRYDNRDSCRLYAGYVNPFQAEAIAYGQWVAACWVASNTAQAQIIAGTRSIPTPEEAVAELPLMVWPV